MSEFVSAGKITNTHGVKGELKAEVWLDSVDFIKTFKRLYINGKEYAFEVTGIQNKYALIRFKGIEDLNAAMAFKNAEITVRKSDAVLPEGTFFIDDILGAEAIDQNGVRIGVLKQVLEYPSGNIYEIHGDIEHLIPDNPEFIVEKDIKNCGGLLKSGLWKNYFYCKQFKQNIKHFDVIIDCSVFDFTIKDHFRVTLE